MINEVFTSIQGEGLLVGAPMNFVRFCRCNLKCKWCDTVFDEGTPMSAGEIMNKLDRKVEWVALTGGEPMLEENLLALIKELKKKGFRALLETNGTLYDKKIFSSCDYVSIDIKPPSSGNAGYSTEALKYCFDNPGKTQVKTVIQDEKDLDFFEKNYAKKYPNWVLQPEWKTTGSIDFGRMIREFPTVRVIPQIHKFMKIK